MNIVYYYLGLVPTSYVAFLDLMSGPELHKTENIPMCLLSKAYLKEGLPDLLTLVTRRKINSNGKKRMCEMIFPPIKT